MTRAIATTSLSAESKSPCFDVGVLSDFSISCDGVALDVVTWPRRGRTLVRILATTAQHRRLRDEVIEILWPEAPSESGNGNLRTLLHRLRRALDPFVSAPVVSAAGWVMLNPDCLWTIDFDRFEELAHSAGDDLLLLREAAELVDGEPLKEDRYDEWAVPVRDHISRQWRQLCLRLATLLQASGSRPQAAGVFERLLERDPLDEEALRGVLAALGEAGLGSEARRRYQQFSQRLRAELDAEPGADTVALAKQIDRDDQENALDQTLLVAPRKPLPAPTTPFVGRKQEAEVVTELLRRPEVRLLTLTGTGGIGKTRLALHVASHMVEEHVGGIFFIPLASLSDPDLVPSTLATALGVMEVGGTPLLSTLIQYLRTKQILLIVDNFEHLLDAVTVLSEIISGCPRVKILVTSRAVLHLDAEYNFTVPPLALPDPQHPPGNAELSEYDAVVLFMMRARAIDANFAVSDEDETVVTEICRRLDGLPLPIELAAARIRVFPLPALLRGLANSLDFLVESAADRAARHQTLRAAVEWSYDLLTPQEQTLFARLSVFTDGCSFESAEAVCNVDGEVYLLEAMTSLVEQSLLQQEGRTEPRFRMLETVRAYATEKLVTRGEEEDMRNRHASFYLRLVQDLQPQLEAAEATWALSRVDAEYNNLRDALSWLRAQESDDSLLRLAIALWPFWYRRGDHREAQNWLDAGVQGAGECDAALLALALLHLGETLIVLGPVEVGTQHVQASLALSHSLGDDAHAAMCLQTLGRAAVMRSDLVTAADCYAQALAAAREANHLLGVATALYGLGTVAQMQGKNDESLLYGEQSLELARRIGVGSITAAALNNLGCAVLAQGNVQRSIEILTEGVEFSRTLNHHWLLATHLNSLGIALLVKGDLLPARIRQIESLRIAQQITSEFLGAYAMEGLALVEEANGKPERAARLWAIAERWRRGKPPPTKFEAALYGESRVRLCERLGTSSFEKVWAEGQSLAFQEAITYALDANEA